MLEGLIERERSRAAEAILCHYRERYLAHAILVPSGRFGLYAAAKALLSPGDRVILSPITCQSVIRALRRAGMIPVFAEIEIETGNIDVARLSISLLREARAIVTTNLYGNPDRAPELKRMAEVYGLLLIEDCAHVLESSIGGLKIGSIGDLSVFSFKKYFDLPGGVVTLRTEAASRTVRAIVAAETESPADTEEKARFMQFLLAEKTSTAVVSGLSTLYRRLHGNHVEMRNGDGHAWPDGPMRLPTTASLLRVADFLSRKEAFVCERIAAVSEIVGNCPLECKRSEEAGDVCFLVVPFFCDRRNEVVAGLKRRGVPTYFLYSPPADATLPGRERVEHWCRNVLPVNPLFGREFLEVLRDLA